MISINYFIKPNGHTLMARIRYNYQHLTDISTKIKVTGSRFDFKSGKFDSSEYELNKQLNQFEAQIHERHASVKSAYGDNPPADVLIQTLKNKSEAVPVRNAKSITLSWMVAEYRRRLANGKIFNAKSGKPLSKETIDNWIAGCNRLDKFIAAGNDMDFSKYNLRTMNALGNSLVEKKYDELISSFKAFLTGSGKLSDYTIHKVIYNFRQMIRYFCKRESIELGSLLDGLKYKKTEKEVEIISSEQVRWLINNYELMLEDCTTQEQRNTVDYMVIGVLLNQRKGDMNSWNTNNLYESDGRIKLKFKPRKTRNTSGVIVDIPLPDQAIQIFNKNAKKYSGKLMPPLSAAINNRIKVIAGRYEIFHNEVQVFKKGQYVRVRQCDAMHIHQMRASGTSDKLLHMPEAMVREWTGHTHDSEAFARYVKVSQEAKTKFADQYFNT